MSEFFNGRVTPIFDKNHVRHSNVFTKSSRLDGITNNLEIFNKSCYFIQTRNIVHSSPVFYLHNHMQNNKYDRSGKKFIFHKSIKEQVSILREG